MAAQTILIIRHAEKPELGAASAIDATGAADPESLTPRGWQRAGAWAELFAPSLGRQPALPTPTTLFASAPTDAVQAAAGNRGSKSRRPLETVTPLAAKLGFPVDQKFAKGQEAALASAISSTDGVVLVCWQHEDIISIAQQVAPDAQNIPADWPGDRFNVVFRLDRPDSTSPWLFSQSVPIMLQGDKADTL